MAVTIHILVLRGCTPIVPVGLADMLRKTALLDEYVPGFPVRKDLQVRLVSSTRDTTVECAGGLRLGCDETLSSAGRSALVLVPAVDPPIEANLEANREVVPWLARAWQQGAQVASACTGAFLLGEAGLLNGRSATTHWAFADDFARRYPKVRLQPMAVLVDQGRLITAGGATSYLSLAVYLVERLFGPEAARLASRLFLVDPNKAPQSAYAVFATQRAHGDASILRAQDIIERELAQAPSVEELARRVAMSRRNFVRRFKQATGNAPREYLQRARVEAAKRSLEAEGPHSIAEVVSAVGYGDGVAFRRQFQRWTGLTPSEYRQRYGPRTAPAVVTSPGAAGTRAARWSLRAP